LLTLGYRWGGLFLRTLRDGLAWLGWLTLRRRPALRLP
jgi:hypothetical protein